MRDTYADGTWFLQLRTIAARRWLRWGPAKTASRNLELGRSAIPFDHRTTPAYLKYMTPSTEVRASTAAPSRSSGFAANCLIILGCFCLLLMASLPTLLSFDLWIFKDRSSFLNLDYLFFDRHYRLGVDICYSYGLLPVLLQHLVCIPFGRSFKPMIGCTVIAMVLSAIFWAALLEHLPRQRRWLFAVAALSQIILLVNPNWPYSLVVLSVEFALLFVLKDRLDIALAISAVGCFCVPSLPIVLAILIGFVIVLNWMLSPGRRLDRLAALFAPAVLVYASLATILGLVFGFKSLAATALPLAGARYYQTSGYGSFGAFLSFLHPPGYSLKYYIAYYIGSQVTWFVLCTLFLFGLAIVTLAALPRGRRLSGPGAVVVLAAILMFVFTVFAYGSRGQHSVYEGFLAAAALVGISMLPQGLLRNASLLLFLATGMLGETGAVYKTYASWRASSPVANYFGLYVDKGFAAELPEIVAISRQHRTLMLSYATGQHLYYPTIEDPDAWFLLPGLLFPSQKQAIVDQINHADIVVEDLTSPPELVDQDADIQAALAAMRPGRQMTYFRVWQREPAR